MLDAVHRALAESELARVSGSLGLFVSIVGFIFTIISVMRSKKASEAAEIAAKEAREALLKVDYFSDCTRAISILEEARRILLTKDYQFLLDRFNSAKRLVIQVKSASPSLSEDQLSTLQSAVSLISTCEQTSIKLSSGPSGNGDSAQRCIRTVTKVIDGLNEFISTIRAMRGLRCLAKNSPNSLIAFFLRQRMLKSNG